MAKKQKFYTVWEGNKPGIYDNWEDCKAAIKGFKRARFMSFETFGEAKKALNASYEAYKGKSEKRKKLTPEQLKRIGEPNYNSIAVDAASSGNPGKVEYRGVDTKTKKVLFKQGPFEEGTNNIGEFLALVHALAFLKKQNSNRIVYTDSRIAMGWVKKKACNTKLKMTHNNKTLFELIHRAEKWLRTNPYHTVIVKWETQAWGEIPADYGRK